ncbi:hypothetical protein BGX31_003218 [Mortierella sp. GBA43]|nr:hypothetical protein BGX31_003218 [Mortierella sp. GBA43]
MVSAPTPPPTQWGFLDVGMVIGPVTGYIHQYYTIYMQKTSRGFSSATCGVLLFANITRIFFWLGDPFEVPLLYQSILMIIVQLLLLEICVRYFPWSTPLPTPVTGTTRFHPTTGSGAERITTRASRPHAIGWFRETAEQWAFTFWNWPTIWPYFIFIIIYTSVLSVLMYFFGNKSLFVECLGFVALGIEATVPMPQAIHNYHTKSTVGFSPSIVLMWVIGDSVKMYYFISQHAKFQFIGCGAVQLCVDVVIIVQTIIYSKWWKRRMGSSTHLDSDPSRSSMDALLGGEPSRNRQRDQQQAYGTEPN